MPILTYIAAVVTFAATLIGMKRDLMMLQQNSNRNDRYIKWIESTGESTKVARLCFMIVCLMCLVKFMPHIIASGAAILVSIWAGAKLISKKYKKPLVWTKRALRIYLSAVVIILVLAAVVAGVSHGSADKAAMSLTALFSGSFAVSYWWILAANHVLKPVEKRINKRYYDEAADILASIPDLKVIGVTGSYGKTSTKHYLYRILSEHFDVVMTPGNFNTTLGVIRTVRENMKPYHQVFIAEMGAKQPGDIKEICDLVHPTIGIITAVGPQHLESFKTIEKVQQTKFELADALPADGFAVLNDDFEYIANRKVCNTHCLRYSVDPSHKADYLASDITYTPGGTDFTIVDNKGDKIRLHTRLVGRCNVSNLMAAVIVALKLGVPKDKIRYAVERIEQVEHRLSIRRHGTALTIIDDAYNSNPVGAAMALEVLGSMKGGKRIIITPGMIELGEDQYKLNKEFGEQISGNADIAFVVGDYNKEAISDGIKASDSNVDVRFAHTFNEAHAQMLTIAQPGDTVLFENDLPDTFK